MVNGRLQFNRMVHRTPDSYIPPEKYPVIHEAALKALKKGDTVSKYGEDIGKMVADTDVGEHVHVQNLKTKRW